MTGRLLKRFKQQISQLELEPSVAGCFEVSAGDKLLYSKLKTGQFPDEAKVEALVEQELARK